MNGFVAATAIGLGLFLAPIAVPVTATASPLCDHRGMAHVEKHGGTIKDREYHLARGERVTCESEAKDHDGERNWGFGRDRHRWWRND